MKIVKIVFLLVALGWGANTLAARIACVTVTNPTTGDREKVCMYVDLDSMATRIRQWSFLQTIMTLYDGDGNYGYDAYYSSLEWRDVVNCEEGQSLVADQEGTFLDGFSCRTNDEIMADLLRDAEIELVDWFWDDGGCQTVITAATALTGYGVARVIARKTIRKLLKEIEEAATPEAKEIARRSHLHYGDATGAVGILAGISIGTLIEDALCDALRNAAG